MGENDFDATVRVPGFEERVYHECLDCGESVSNPICPSCIFKEFEVWVSKYPRLERKIVPLLRRFLRAHRHFDEDSQGCVVCKNNKAYSCPYCFSEFIFTLLKENGACDDVLKDYMGFFNFDFGHFGGKWGYWKEAERLGVY